MKRKLTPDAYPSKDEVDKTKAETGNESITLAGAGLSEDRGTVECCLRSDALAATANEWIHRRTNDVYAALRQSV